MEKLQHQLQLSPFQSIYFIPMAQHKQVMHAQKNTRMGQHSSPRKAGYDFKLLYEILPWNRDFTFKAEFFRHTCNTWGLCL